MEPLLLLPVRSFTRSGSFHDPKFEGLIWPPLTTIDSGRIGKVYSVNLNVSPVSLVELTIVADKDLKLNPHGHGLQIP